MILMWKDGLWKQNCFDEWASGRIDVVFFGGGRIDIVFISVGNGPDGPDKIMLNQTQFYYVTTDLVID